MFEVQPSDLPGDDGVKQRRRVSLIGTLPPIKGVSAYTAHLLDALASEREIDADFIGFRSVYPAWAYPGGAPNDELIATPEWPGVDVRTILTWYNPISWVRAGLGVRGDVVHAQWWSPILAPVYAVVLGLARLRGKKVVLTVHNVAPHESSFVSRLFNRRILRFGHAFIVHSERNKAALRQLLGDTRKRISVVPHGVLDTPRTELTRSEAAARLGLRGGKVILCFGHIRLYKGVDVLLRAFAQVARTDPDAELVIAGTPWTDWQPYQQIIDDAGIADRVKLFLRYIPVAEIEAFFVAADVVVLPYRHFDAQSGAGARALPFGRALVVTDVGGLPELTRRPEAVMRAGDVDALAGGLRHILNDDLLRKRLAADSLSIAQTLAWPVIARRTEEVYRGLLADGLEDRPMRDATESVESDLTIGQQAVEVRR